MDIKRYRPKELSWLSFNARVLQEAEDKSVPLLERIKFMGIYSNNLDEFFRVRVATLKRLAKLGKKAIEVVGGEPKEVLREINRMVLQQRDEYEKIYEGLLKDLRDENIFIVNEKELDAKQGEYVKNLFEKKIRAQLNPIMLDQAIDFPALKDDAIYLAVTMRKRGKKNKTGHALIEVPTNQLSRFVILPKRGEKQYIILLEDVIRYELKDIFYFLDYSEFEAHIIKFTKDAELDLNDDVMESYVEKVSESLKKRNEGPTVRFIYDADIPNALLRILISKLGVTREDAVIPGGRHHNFKDFIGFPDLGRTDLKQEKLPPLPHPDLKAGLSMFSQIAQKEVLLTFPYQSFSHFVDLLREASIDPDVQSVMITLYRVGKRSEVINALITAALNGKNVTAVVELQARFDEEANIKWSKRMREAGVKVIYGVEKLKVHSKLCLITRKENKKESRYACIGTGNFNEDSSTVFSDHLLMTHDRKLTNEVFKIFDFFNKNFKRHAFNHLVLSPFSLRNKMMKLMNNEIENARKGKPAFIYLKLNNLVDDQVIRKLEEASMEGVEVKVNVRGMFSMVPNEEGYSRNITAIGIIDRFLEHSRIYLFCNGGENLYYLSSADLMARNMDRRIEVTCPIYNKELQKDIRAMIDLQFIDNVKARELDATLQNNYVKRPGKKIRSQYALYEYIKNKK